MKTFSVPIFTILFILLFLVSPIYALDEGFYSTISFTIRSVGKEGVTYEPNHVAGEYTSEVVSRKNISYFTSDNYRSRRYNKTHTVALPPFSKVDIGYYWYNNTPDERDIETIRIPLSREHIDNGDITQLLYENTDQEFKEGITCTNILCRGGKYIDIDGVGLLASDIGGNPRNGVVIETFTVKPAVELVKWEVEIWSSNLSQVTLYVKNNTKEYLNDIWVNYKATVSKVIDLGPYEERKLVVYKQCILSEEDANCGVITFYDRNTKAHCMVYGSDWGNYLRPDSISVWNKIGEEWVSGAQTQPGMEGFCIQRLPYVYSTKELIVYFDPPTPEPTQEEYWKDILGLEILPITNYQGSTLDNFFRLIKPVFTDNLNIL